MRINRKKATINSKNTVNFLQLNKNLMDKFTDIQVQIRQSNIIKQTKQQPQKTTHQIKSEFIQDYQIIDLAKNNPYTSILQKAKIVTTLNKQQIERAKKTIKKSQQQSQGAFLTGCGLYTSQDGQEFNQFPEQNQQIDLNDALKYLVKNQKDDLAELRKLIRKTNTNLNQYSNNINKTQNQVQQAAQLFGKQLNLDLKMKITKCGFHKSIESQAVPKRKISTSNRAKR